MTQHKFKNICMDCVKLLRGNAPKDTGNLAYNGVRYEWENADTFVIYIDQEIAPYMPFTNEKWTSSRWKGKKNPNEGWFNNAVIEIKNYLEGILTK